MQTYYDQTFSKIDFAMQPIAKGIYENCIFNGCQFNQVDISKIEFSNCQFTDCIFTSPNLSLTAFKEVVFTSCKLVGLHFEHCSPFLFEGHTRLDPKDDSSCRQLQRSRAAQRA